tara:strand:- start:2638 stop:3843 length:1206 start_codon:yes stop_codon:yes gene_type:complete
MKYDVVILGLGYIGLPTSAVLAKNNFKVLGVDTNPLIVDTVNDGKIHIIEPELPEIVAKVVKEGNLKASTKLLEADVYIIVVPTPFDDNYNPDISFVVSATESVIPLLKENDLFIIESTCPIGTTENIKQIIFSKRPKLKGKINIAYCPERVLPGNIVKELIYNDRVVGGIDKKSTKVAKNFYSKFVRGEVYETNSKTAEMCKLVENSSRDVQIAFANELSMICKEANIDVWELIDLANKHPRVNILSPGSGVGGHCIAVDPYFIINKFPKQSKLISTSRNVNLFKTDWCINEILNKINHFKKINNRLPNIGLMGLSFKPDVDDFRESPSLKIVENLHKNYDKNLIKVSEPNLSHHQDFELSEPHVCVQNSDIIVFLVSHSDFKNLEINNKLVIDFCGINK